MRTFITLLLLLPLTVIADDAQIETGKQVYDHWCTPCHGAGSGFFGVDSQLPGTAALKALYKGEKPEVLSERTDMPPEYIKVIVRQGVSVMPFFRKTEIDDHQLEAISAYLTRNNP
jgi:mono/diheme cytochrome c family protein